MVQSAVLMWTLPAAEFWLVVHRTLAQRGWSNTADVACSWLHQAAYCERPLAEVCMIDIWFAGMAREHVRKIDW